MKNKFYPNFLIAVLLTAFFCCIGCTNEDAQQNTAVSSFSGSIAERGRPVQDLSDYRLVYYEPVESEGSYSTANIQESDDPFIISDYGPFEELPSEIKKPSIYAVFSQPVVPLAKLGDPIREDSELFSIDPPLAGVYRWYGSKLLSFEPDADVIPQQRYTVTVSDKIKSLGGKSLQGSRTFNFETERLSVLDWELGATDDWVWNQNAHPEDAKYIKLMFSYPVNLSEIAKWIEIRAAGRTWSFSLSRLPEIDEKHFKAEQGVLVSIRDALPLDSDVVIELKEGACSEAGWLGTKTAQSWTYHTLLPFSLEDAWVNSYSRPQTQQSDTIPVSLRFSQNVETNGIERFISVEGFPALKKENFTVFGSTVIISQLPLEYENNYFVRISPDFKDLYGRSLGRDERIEINVGEASSYVFIRNSGSRMLEAGFPPKIIWETQNPVSLRSAIAAANSPYERIPLTNLNRIDVNTFSANKKNYIFEDLSPYLNASGKGSAAFRWEYQTKSSWQKGRVDTNNTWLTVQVTNIGITVRYAYNMVLVWATHLSDGTPAAGAAVDLLESGEPVVSGQTDAQGLAVFNFSNDEFVSLFSEPQSYYWNESVFGNGLRVRVSEGSGNSQDKAEFIPNDSHNVWRFNVGAAVSPFSAERERMATFLFTDRGLYRPGETVTFRGIDRRLQRGKHSVYQGPYRIEVSSGAYQAPVITALTGNTTINGGSYGSFTLPDNIDPGEYRIIYKRGSAPPSGGGREQETSISFTVANFERLRFESSLRFTDTTVFQGEKLNASLSASYLAGGGLSGAPFSWHLTREPASFIPGGSDGAWGNWCFGPESYDSRSYVGSGQGTLGPDGKASISQDIRSDGIEGAVYSYRMEASVQDAARQEIASSASILAHPASFYIAARIDSGALKNAVKNENASGSAAFAASASSAYFLNAQMPATLSWALVAPDGSSAANALRSGQQAAELSIQLVWHEWKQARQAGIGGKVNLVWERVEEIVEQRTEKISPPAGANDFISGVFNFTPGTSGLWEIRLQGKDQKQRIAVTRFRFYVSGAGWVRWDSDDVDTITLTADRQNYAPGDTAKILVRSPLEKGKYLLTLEREGIISQKIIELNGSAMTIDVPIEESYIPVIYVALCSYTVRSGPPQNTYYDPDLDKPKGVFGVTPVYVDTSTRNYKVEVINSKSVYSPAEKAEVTIKVTLNGRPSPNTEVTYMAVDRGVVDLINYHVPNPVHFFYNPWNFPLGVKGADSRSLLIDPVTYNISDLQGGDSEADDAKIQERKDFRPTAVFEPYLVTGADGTVKVQFTLPDSLTTYRCTAVAAGLNNFGIQEQDLQVSAPLTAVAALPRKLRWRDTGTASLILTNLENVPVEASVSLATGTEGDSEELIIAVDGDDTKTVTVPANSSTEVSFKLAAMSAGDAQLVFTLRSPKVNERIIRKLLVDRPVLLETVTSIGSLGSDKNFIEEGMIIPSLVPQGTGSVTVSLSASRIAALKEAMGWLLDYPYGCLEQRTARLLPIVAFGDHLDAFDISSPLKTAGVWDPKKIVEEELATIAKSQLPDGSFPYWPGNSTGNAYVSLRVAHIAALAKNKGISLPNDLNTRRLISWITAAATDSNAIPVYNRFSKDMFLKGYSLWIRAMYDEMIGSELSSFLRQGDALGISGWAFAGLAAVELGQTKTAVSAKDSIRRFIRPGTQSLDLTDTWEASQGIYWGGDTDRYALALMLYQALSPEDDMTQRLANTLIGRQRRGLWGSTASSYWAVLAFGALGDMEEMEWKAASGAPLTASVSFGGASLFNAEFAQYGGVPVSYNGLFSHEPILGLPRESLLPLRIERTGTAKLYYTASLRYGIPTELAGARDEGLGVFAETFDAEGNLIKDAKLISGKTYTRRITLSSSRDRTFVALRAPVPSGAEIIDAAFVTSSTAVTSTLSEDEEIYRPAPLRLIMDDAIDFHWDLFKAGRQQVEFRFRAVMPGIYPTPPTAAECMYEGEIFGRSAGELVRIQ